MSIQHPYDADKYFKIRGLAHMAENLAIDHERINRHYMRS
ncbi:MAG: hypothetical protein ACI9FB_000591 [Candidatus Azotimanducaceae bacterium]|jgi:hypothetical protein